MSGLMFRASGSSSSRLPKNWLTSSTAVRRTIWHGPQTRTCLRRKCFREVFSFDLKEYIFEIKTLSRPLYNFELIVFPVRKSQEVLANVLVTTLMSTERATEFISSQFLFWSITAYRLRAEAEWTSGLYCKTRATVSFTFVDFVKPACVHVSSMSPGSFFVSSWIRVSAYMTFVRAKYHRVVPGLCYFSRRVVRMEFQTSAELSEFTFAVNVDLWARELHQLTMEGAPSNEKRSSWHISTMRCL